MRMTIDEIAELLDNAYLREGFQKLFYLNNDEVIAMAGYDGDNISIQVCNDDGDTKIVLTEFNEPGDGAVNWDKPASIIKDYIEGNDLSIDHVYEWADTEDEYGSAFKEMFNTRRFESLYRETVENITRPRDERKFEFCLQKLNEDNTGVLDEFQTVTEFGLCGQDAYNKVREAYPGWRVYTWGIFND